MTGRWGGAAKLFPKIRGFGDYKLKHNTLMFGGMSPPMIQNSVRNGGIIIRHREYIGDLGGTIAFTNRNYPLNPGLVGTFPWLAQVASAFEQYRWRGLIFEFRSTCADAVIPTATELGQGTVIMATQYNALTNGFSSKIEMENYEYANSSKPANSFMHPVECAVNVTPNTPLYVRSGAIPANSDERLYDIGNFCIATQGIPGSTNTTGIGEIWATFEIELFKPKFNIDHAVPLQVDHFQADNRGQAGNLSALAPFGPLLTGFYAGGIGGKIRYLTDGAGSKIRYTFPPDLVNGGDCFQVTLTSLFSVALVRSDVSIGLSGVNGIDGIDFLNANSNNPGVGGNFQWDAPSISQTQQTKTCYVAFISANSLGPGGVYEFDLTGFATRYPAVGVPASTDLMISRIPAEMGWAPAQGPQDLQVFGI